METVRVSAEPGSAADAAETVDLAQQREATWLVIDGYHFSADYQRTVADSDARVLAVDDGAHAGHYCADTVLNQNIYATEQLYAAREKHVRLLLGTDYVLLRREFKAWQEWRRDIPDVAHKVLVTLGGSDPDNVTLKVVQALKQVDQDGLEARIVVGGSNPHLGALEAAVGELGGALRLETDVSDMPRLMAWADVAVTAGGSTCWELAFMGLPSVIIVLADNQRPVADGLAAAGAGVSLGWHEDVTVDRVAAELERLASSREVRRQMSDRGKTLVDGRGATRTVTHLLDAALHLRPVCEEDCRLLWEWANEPGVRASAFSPDAIPWEEHVLWFERKLRDPGCLVFVGSDGRGEPVGQVRFDVTRESEAEIDVSVDVAKRGLGHGHRLIRMATKRAFQSRSLDSVVAFVKSDNHASIGAFGRAGFSRQGLVNVKANEAVRFVKAKER